MEKTVFISSDEVDARISELEELKENGTELDADEARELEELLELQAEGQDSPDWPYGETLIRSDHFLEYTKDLIEDAYPMPKGFNMSDWPYRHMSFDYEAAADELAQDYIEVSFGDVVYLIRA